MSVTADVVDRRKLGTVHDYGDQALLLEFDSTAEVLAWMDAIRRAELLGVLDIVPAARTILVKLAGPRYQAPTRQRLGTLRIEADLDAELAAPGDRTADVTIDVVYDGPDLDEVAQLTGLTPEQVVAAHTGKLWRVGFGGFAPGFAYLVGGDERLEVPRRAEPRTKVPAGAVGLAGEFSGVYPRESPGGWQLIGRISQDQAPLWDIDRDPPALLTSGLWVQFRAVQDGAGS
ncbi:sensor histidine kinase inhibitor, KipI family [Mycolicibacterium rutilum]|uniref:Sensor histidine kinase inhibitor, KipI family n=1 Tax=Mycolicibacterium rutilum TaxID=370526 RepID=A0A1H6IX02_MYCRU|nr:allophanate hydrolase subunit 1 [Mycolicibacterium rutilum]SEH51580.1 sensor histidine kinase inhibitor, KipI family [Mycolicibacterium rutilum]